MLSTSLSLILITYLPGALIFRLPIADRWRRSALPAEERFFWALLISLTVSSIVSLGLAWTNSYTFVRLLYFNGGCCLLIGFFFHRRLCLEKGTPKPNRTALIPIALIWIGLLLYFPPAEYIMGGKDPGTYMNEGIQIAQRGSLITTDHVISSVPQQSRDLFFPSHDSPTYYSTRFMGFFLMDPNSGAVLGQFPHLYPIWIAIGYGLDGLTGTRQVIGFWSILGVIAVYFVGARLVGRLAAATGATLLAVHVLQIWYARYPNTELLMQALLFAGLLAYTRVQIDGDRFFGPVAGTLLGLLLFLRFSAVLAIVAVVGATLISLLDNRRLRASFIVPFALWVGLGSIYLLALMSPYMARPLSFFQNQIQPIHFFFLTLGAIALVSLSLVARYPAVQMRARTWIPTTLIFIVLVAVTYAYFIRQAAPGLAPHDAEALRTFTSFYLTPYGLVAALTGYIIVVHRSFWKSPAFILTLTTFGLFLFYKARIIPEHFWMGRRFLPVILPGMLLLISAAALGDHLPWRKKSIGSGQPKFSWLKGIWMLRFGLGLVFIILLGRHYVDASRSIVNHVEYEGLIPRVEQLAQRFNDEDLILVEARGASDIHVLALPLAYIYAKNVLVLNSPQPDKIAFLEFLTWARTKYDDVFFVGGGGTDLLSNAVAVSAIGSERFQIPEYQSEWNVYPTNVRYKEFDYGIYQFINPSGIQRQFELDVGTLDDLHVRSFHAKEETDTNGTTFRWTQDVSYISILGTSPDNRLLTLWLNDGGRPEGVEPARVAVSLNDRPLGVTNVTTEFLPYNFSIPAELADQIAQSDTAAQLSITSNTWIPRDTIGAPDDRTLGVMVDRVEVK